MSIITHVPTEQKTNLPILMGVIACFILSGFAALLYQTAWMRQFSVTFGTSELAVAAVLAAYMGGLALGANLAARFIHKVTRPVLFYGILEGGIALAALAVPLFLKLANMMYIAVFGGQAGPVDASGLGQSFFYLIVAFLVLVLPTAMMGATLPLLTKYVVQTKEQIGSRVGLLYATNTAGAIGGTLVAGFLLLPRIGLMGTIWVGVAINVLVFVLAAGIATRVRKAGIAVNAAEAEPDSESEVKPTGEAVAKPGWSLAQVWILPVMLLSGAVSFVYEVLWTRLLGHILGGSITAFSTMLAGFLSGIAIGSAIASRFAKRREQAIALFVIVQIGIALTSIAIYQLLPSAIPDSAGLKGNALLAFMVLLPATIFIGATFPLAVRVFAKDAEDAAPASARVYSWNTVGAIVGATIAAFFIIPLLKYEGAIKLAVIMNVVLALIAALFLVKPKRNFFAGVAAVTAIAIGIFYQPAIPEDILRTSPVYTLRTGDLRFYEVGRSATVVMIETDGYLNIRTNGLPEASSLLKGAPPAGHNQYMLSTMPVIARPDIEDMLIIGFGGGNAVEAVPSSVKNVDVIEIEREVIAANAFYGDERRIDPLKDPRVNIVINDARSALMLTDKKYGGIVSQPSHPWTAGASHLYTREFMQLANEHLTDDGVFLQWMNTQFVDEFLFKSLCATMLDVFPYVRVYMWQNEVMFFLGSNRPLDVERQIMLTGKPFATAKPQDYLEKGIGSVEDVIAALSMDHENVRAFAREGKVLTDNNNLMATRSARAMDEGTVIRGQSVYKTIKAYDPLLQIDSDFYRDLPAKPNFMAVAARLKNMTMQPRAVDLSNTLVDRGDAQGLAIIGLGQVGQGQSGEAEKNLLLTLQAEPENQQARFALLEPYLGKILKEEDLPQKIEEQVVHLRGPAAAVMVAAKAAFQSDMQKVSELDPAMAQTKPSDPWYNLTAKLRAQWRIKVTSEEHQPRLANEATQIVDNVVAFKKDPELESLRMQSTFIAKDYLSTYQTIRDRMSTMRYQINNFEGGYSSITDKNRTDLTKYIGEMKVMTENLKEQSVVDQALIEDLKIEVDNLERRLSYL